METWEDCMASLRAGAEPELVLPRIRELFSRLPQPQKPVGSSKHTGEDEGVKPPTANLYHMLEGAGDHVFQVPYLRPPLFLWDVIKRASGEFPDERETLFDSELDIDLIGQFEPRFVDPPSDEVRRLLKGECMSDEPDGQGENGSDQDSFFEDSIKDTNELHRKESVRRKYGAEDFLSFSSSVQQFMLSPEAADVGIQDNVNSLPTFPAFSLQEWSLIFSGMGNSFNISAHGLTKFLLSVNQQSLAMLTLQTLFPFLLAGNPGSEDVEDLMTLVSSAASMAELDKYPTVQVRALLDMYRGTDGGILSALAQLHIVNNTKKGC